MSENRRPAAGRLFYTFGTILLMAVITVCVMNFIQDSRLLNKPAVAASVNESANVPSAGSKTPANGKTPAKAKTTANAETPDGKDSGTKEIQKSN